MKNKNIIEIGFMKKNNFLVTMTFWLLSFYSMNLITSHELTLSLSQKQFDSLCVKLHATLTPERFNKVCIALQKQVLDNQDEKLVAFWKGNQSLIDLDQKLQKTKESRIEYLFKRESLKFSENNKLSQLEKENVLKYMQQNKEKVCRQLWLNNMYGMKNKIQSDPDTSSYLALPYIKEIHTTKNYNSSLNTNLR